jgi:cytochrome c oxidase subunit 2
MAPAAGAKPMPAAKAPLAAPAAVAAAASAAPAAAMAAALPGATLYFEVGSAELPGDVAIKLEGILLHVTANAGAKLAISGFQDASVSTEASAALSKERAEAVGDALKEAGIAEGRIEVKKPESINVTITGSGEGAAARRVEVKVM